MILKLAKIVHKEQKHKPTGDRRRRVNYVLAVLRDAAGNEYRKGFSSYGEPVVPQSGTHETLNALKEQF